MSKCHTDSMFWITKQMKRKHVYHSATKYSGISILKTTTAWEIKKKSSATCTSNIKEIASKIWSQPRSTEDACIKIFELYGGQYGPLY